MSHRLFIRLCGVVCLVGGATLIYGLYRQGIPLWVAYLASICLVTFLCYGFDKMQAKANRTRLPEALLHLCALIGGSPGALLGQVAFRHKTEKCSFRLIFWAIVLLQCMGLGLWFYVSANHIA